MIPGLELAAGWLAMYAWRKARRVAGRADAEVDRALDTGMDKLHDLVSVKLGDDPALARLTAEAEAGRELETPEISDRTRQRVLLALEEAAETDAAFSAGLADLIARLQQAGPVTAPNLTAINTGSAIATGGGVANTGVIGGNLSTGGR